MLNALNETPAMTIDPIMDVWMPAVGIPGLLLPLPSLVWAWQRWFSDRLSQDRPSRKQAGLFALAAVTLAVFGWALDVACLYKRRAMPFLLCNTGWEKGATTLLCIAAIVAALLGTKRCRLSTIVCGCSMIAYMLSFGALVE
jgi:hypothetical protein